MLRNFHLAGTSESRIIESSAPSAPSPISHALAAMPRTKKIHQLKLAVRSTLLIHQIVQQVLMKCVANPAGLVEMESVQFVARDDAASSEADIFPAEMDGQSHDAFIS